MARGAADLLCLTTLSVGSVLDLFQARRGAANPVARRVHVSRVNRFSPRIGFCFFALLLQALALFLAQRLRLLDFEFPVAPELVERVIHRSRLDRADATAA